MELVDSIAAGRVGAVASPERRVMPRAPHPVSPRTDARPAMDGVRHDESGTTVWRIRCGDMIQRERCVTVFVDAGEVVIVAPAGETARLSGGQLNQLRMALHEASKLAGR